MARTPFGSKGREEGSDGSWTPPSAPSGSSSTPGGLTAFIDQGSEFEGKLSFRDTVRIDGRFQGEIASENTLIVGESGEIEATIRSNTVVVSGTVLGSIHASSKVVLHKTARVNGDVETPSIAVEEGAVFNGQLKMTSADGRQSSVAPLKAIPGGNAGDNTGKTDSDES